MKLQSITPDGVCGLSKNHKHPRKITVNLLQLLTGLDQAINTADVARPPSHRAQEAGRLRGDLCVEHTVHQT